MYYEVYDIDIIVLITQQPKLVSISEPLLSQSE